MLKEGRSIEDATAAWVSEMNAIPTAVIEKLMRIEPKEWRELTVPVKGDRVYVYNHGYGHIKDLVRDDNGERMFIIGMDDWTTSVKCEQYEFEVKYDSTLPMWPTMWTFGTSVDDYWLEELGGINSMSECGFRVYENEDLGYVFGIDGAGYDFYAEHWVPLYKKRSLAGDAEMHGERTLCEDSELE